MFLGYIIWKSPMYLINIHEFFDVIKDFTNFFLNIFKMFKIQQSVIKIWFVNYFAFFYYLNIFLTKKFSKLHN